MSVEFSSAVDIVAFVEGFKYNVSGYAKDFLPTITSDMANALIQYLATGVRRYPDRPNEPLPELARSSDIPHLPRYQHRRLKDG